MKAPKRSVRWSEATLGGVKPEKEELEAILRASSKGLALLRDILTKELDTVRTLRAAKDTYESPAWPYLQADYNATERNLQKVLDLLEPLCYNSRTE